MKYVDQNTAQAGGLVNTNNNAVYMGVDYANVASSGRPSVRITSKKSYTHGLIILDASHMPGGVCGTWPAFWTVGPNWPNSGEIDIIEGVNSQQSNSMALHTNSGCSISNNGLFSGEISTPNCFVNAPDQANNAGCAILTPNSASYGAGFNEGQGGVYATEWTSSHISIWFFPRSAIPSDISTGTPNPSNWGSPVASFTGGCDIDNFFESHQIVFDTTFCGDWAGNVWSSDSVCGSKAPTCESFVQNNPSAFADAYWSVNSLKVYQSTGDNSAPSSAASQGPPTAASASAGIPSASGSSVPPGPPPTVTLSASGFPTTGFSRGGNGRHTRTFGVANFAATPSSSGEVDPTTTIGPPWAAVEDSAGAVGEVEDGSETATAVDVSSPEITSPTTYRARSLDSVLKEKRDAALEPAPLASVVEVEGVVVEPETIKTHLLTHRHKHINRHLFRLGVAGGVGEKGE